MKLSTSMSVSHPFYPRLTAKQEKILWDKELLNMDTSKGLSRAVIFYLIKSFAVRQGRELRKLETCHVTFDRDNLGFFVAVNLEGISSRHHGRIVKRYDDPANPRSVYKIFKKYRSFVVNEGPFLVRPISSIKDYICYSPFPLGVIGGTTAIQTLMKDAGYDSPDFANYSLSLQAVDILVRFGTGRHCLASWILGNGLKRMPSAAACDPTNCEEANPEISLLVSRLLDAPYPINAVDIIHKIDFEEAVKEATMESKNSFSSWISNLSPETDEKVAFNNNRKFSVKLIPDLDDNESESATVHEKGMSPLSKPNSSHGLTIVSVSSISKSAFDAQGVNGESGYS